jgi:TM2 domain-containing membrane protein YozV
VRLHCAISLHGCDLVIATHDLANWLQKETYLIKWGYMQQTSAVAQLNSCNDDQVKTVCSGHGQCTTFTSKSSSSKFTPSSLSFCKCDADWADPECSTRRKSQWKLFLLALFGGLFGADQFYLGYPVWGAAKLLTLGGFGFWWVYDIVRAGSGAVYARDFRVAADLPRAVYLLGILALVGVVSFFWSLESYVHSVRTKRKAMLKQKESEEAKHNARAEHIEGPRFRLYDESADFSTPPAVAAYGSMPAPVLPRAGAPLARPLP